MRFVLLFVIAMLCSCGDSYEPEPIKAGDPCEIEKHICCIDSKPLECVEGTLLPIEGDIEGMCDSKRPRYKPCT